MGFYRAEWGIRSHLMALVGAFLGAFILPVVGFFLGYLFLHDYPEEKGIGIFLFIALPLTVLGVWLGQVAGCALALRLANYERVGFTSFLLLLLAPVGLVLSLVIGYVIITYFVPHGNTIPAWWLIPCLVPMLLMPVLARLIALAKRPRHNNLSMEQSTT
jgi:hypothetical protein